MLCHRAGIVGDSARVTGSGVTMADGEVGLRVSHSAFVQLEKLSISQQQLGILIWERAQVRLSNSKLSENWVGLEIQDGNVKLLDTTFEANRVGLEIRGGVVTAERVTITRSQRDGLIAAGKEAVVSLVASKLSDNGVHPNCRWVAWVCNGLTVREAARVWMTNSVIQGNADWGIGAWKRECGYERDLFEGQVTLLGTVQIEGNNTSGES
ncbi:MAG: right-handed parallel beta-helix repeat-containing protein [Candidatus Bipolaricaulota bacterium]|nr:right-handed parallel beta-helix repeat-containing protein [Candidatus Bipolaricaulota bacterium]